MTMQRLLSQAAGRLEENSVPNAEYDARFLLFEVFSLDFARFLSVRNQELSQDEETRALCSRYMDLIEKRASRIPLQQLTGTQGFMGLEFKVNEHVLIPRQDTEILVELVLKEQTDRGKTVLDVCTGSGCIAVSLAALGGYKQVTALDISKEALKVAEENAGGLLGEYKGSFRLLESDMFSGLKHEDSFDVIVSNPPYIPTKVIEGLEPEVRDFEPRLALDGTEDGLFFYRILASQCREHLKPGGCVYLEIGSEQSDAVQALFAGAGYKDIRTIKDLAGLDRVVRAALR